MKISSTVRNTVALSILAGAGLSGCVGDPFYDDRGYNQGYNQPGYQSQRYYDTNPRGTYYDPNYQNRPYYTERPYYSR